ncbi:hypothetical protein ABB37_04648 [Leptomonas pyrrhocoris]|uniref:Uncharacterized protein n=1 Tax=Leptomonas pyrrhocoris TaxID=157538 RepID=A0A0N0DVP5_LEPPY|nr:hypothetical protein ABB37_04648 [Leptomonas pyrrhocoris]KPA80404.1 hypothetical protein ABB37_04648 [Leptomonas pyrrhocoris]|eukprot:XP_015658843.1 hypothetical protein ABB37_04648 [Leptomonas pyrrhocoris]
MFGASSSPPKMELKHSYVAAVAGVATEANGNRRPLSRATVVVGATLAVGVSILVGGRLLYTAAHRTDEDEKGGVTSAAATEAIPSWWQRAWSNLRLHRFAEDDDDAFAGGTGTANLFDAAKTKARQLSKDKSKMGVRLGAASPPSTSVKPGSLPMAKPDGSADIGYPSDIQERAQHIKLVRALLRRQAGIEYSDDDSSTSSDSTDVSLNYHFATTMEATARDDLLIAFATYEDHKDEVALVGTAPEKNTEEEAEELQVNILIKTLEYLDMSNEREKLRCRRIALHREQGRATPASSTDAVYGGKDDDPINAMYRKLAARYGPQHPYEEDDDDEDNGGEEEGDMNRIRDHDFPNAASRHARQFQAMFGPSMMGMDPSNGEDRNTADSVLDRILGQASAAAAKNGGRGGLMLSHHTATAHGNDEDMMEEKWEDEDDAEEADFMDYLQQPDDAAHFYSRKELRQARRDPDNDVRIVGSHGAVFGFPDDEAEAEEDWEDDGEDGADEEVEEGEEDMMPAEPWSRQDKIDFERELFGRIHQLANTYALTAAAAEREADDEDARKLAEREQRRRQQQQQQKSRVVPTMVATGGNPQSLPPVAEGDEEWEDEGEWEDEDEDEEA